MNISKRTDVNKKEEHKLNDYNLYKMNYITTANLRELMVAMDLCEVSAKIRQEHFKRTCFY